MESTAPTRWVGLALAMLATASCTLEHRESEEPFQVHEVGIAAIHQAMTDGRVTSRQLVEAYLARIDAFDRKGPALNSLIVINRQALARADSLDAVFRETGEFVGPLHGIPVIVKDNYDTHDLPTTAGSAVLAGSIPPDDAFQVRRIREAGAIVLAKSNMAEFAFSPFETVGSALPGYSRNPYATNRVTAGSSGGTAAAVAASFGAVGLGTDTGNSIRGPSAHQALVGIRSTMGLTSRDGIVPLYLDRDIGGPMARSVSDAALILDVIAGTDPADEVTAEADQRREASYLDHLREDGLQGSRIGVLRQLSDTDTADPEVLQRFEEALEAMAQAGATIVDEVRVESLDTISGSLWCRRFRPDIEAYLASLGPDAPVSTLDEIVESGRAHPSIQPRLEFFAEFQGTVEENEGCQEAARNVVILREDVRRTLADQELDALVYPTWNNPPRLIGDLTTPHGNNSFQLSPPTGFPAVTVPMGWVWDGLPVGLQMLGDAWSEGRLIELAYAFEKATSHRRPPATTPPLR
jgi:Asp-tRNA(Asn)/Glu-tRNA(Gln) amidotransferase A subunit family amidase